MELTVKFLCALVFFLVTFYFSEVLVQAPSLDDKYCPPGKYSAKTGVCCNMCTAASQPPKINTAKASKGSEEIGHIARGLVIG
ncbi:unnamed protein product [Lampetra planeri]